MVGLIHESTLPYQGGIKGGLKAKSIFNLIITSYLIATKISLLEVFSCLKHRTNLTIESPESAEAFTLYIFAKYRNHLFLGQGKSSNYGIMIGRNQIQPTGRIDFGPI